MEAARRVLRYLKGNPGQGMLLKANSDLSISIFYGAHVHSLEDLQLDILSLLVDRLYPGRRRSKVRYLDSQQKLNIEQWLLQLVS